MKSPRVTCTRVGLSTLVAAAALFTAAPATADPATDFLAKLRESGYDPGSTTYDQQMTLINASTACSMLHYDFTPEQAQDYLRYQLPDVAPAKLAVMVNVAQQTLCGPQFTTVKPDW